MSKDAAFADFIKELPKAALGLAEVTGYLLAGPKGQTVFFDLPAGASVPLHSHGAQWGIVVSGEMELTIGDETKIYRAGECYDIPAGALHGATVLVPSLVIDVFAEPNRYSPQG
ncbi:MAG: cupin domain-containing protein [Deltaproteobacteria bacterium]|nr:cupin domain-containing protein [Deltaproteobacteria bacterium]